MKQHTITADVYAHWGATSPSYRVYVNNDLLTERDFGWPGHEVFIRENIVVGLKPGVHQLRIEQIGNNGKIQVKDITVDGVASNAQFTTTE
jgi:hypothetical protein